MKNVILLIIFTVLLQATGFQIEHNFKKALLKAKTQNKEVMMMYSAVWCPECNYMKDVAFKNTEVSKYIQKHFIVISLDIQKDKLPKGFDYVGIPTFFFIDSNTKLIGKIIGGDRADRFLKKLKSIR
ncbi:MAG: thioredoxin family protein [Epsilonproteobacteria bacterium]|nr:thioredoxin family protein [Campylobacterota bacterium]